MVALLASAWTLMLAQPALAEAPTRLYGEITDNAGALGPHRAEVQAAIIHLYDTDLIKPYVVYIHSFSGLTPTAWADRTAGAGQPVPAPSLTFASAPRHGAVAVPPGHPPSGGSSGLVLAAIAAAVVVLLGLLLVAGRRLPGRGGGSGGSGGHRGHGRPAQPPGPPTAELEAQASHALVATDDAVKTSEQELGFAIARFGEQAAAPFSAALKSARAELAAAFNLRQQLDDDVQETEPVRRSMLSQISGRCMEANRVLDEQSDAFDGLQDLEARVPQVLAEVSSHIDQQNSRSAHSRQTLSQLAGKYTPAAVAVVTTCPDQAGERLEFARERLADARRALADDSRGKAAVQLQAAESAADQAEALLDGIEHMEAELTRASSALPTALREIDADIAAGNAALAGQPDDRAAAVTRAQVAASAVRGQLSAGAPFDPLTALRTLEEADTALDQALASARQERERRDRARAMLDQAMLVARSSVTAAEDFITTRRGGVGAAARTRLAEAQRHYHQAIAYASNDPEAALAEAQRADALGQQARSLAEQDVAEFSYEQHGPVVMTGGFGGGFGGAVLGGILINSMPGGSRRVGSFGGIGTRGRHSIGGMF
jgi:tetratricopeptide (TPR) repeat protein